MRHAVARACSRQADVLLDQGNAGAAYILLRLAAGLAPRDTGILYRAACAASAAGRSDSTARLCERALALDPSLEPVHQLLMSSFLHGELYFELLRRIHELLRPAAYIEIGVETGQTLRLARPETLAIGVDPAPIIQGALPANARLFAQTSDDFFAGDVRGALEGRPLGLAFIDGMHHFEFALRDFTHLERLSVPHGTILVHDCFPHDRATAERQRHQAFWTGDVWRLVVLLKKYRPDLSIHTVATPPSGLAIVRNLDPSSALLTENLDRLCEEFLALDYSYLEKDRAHKLNLFPNDWKKIQGLLLK